MSRKRSHATAVTAEPVATSPAPDKATSPLYDRIVEDFFLRAEKEKALSGHALSNLRAAFAFGPPKVAELVHAFKAEDEVE